MMIGLIGSSCRRAAGWALFVLVAGVSLPSSAAIVQVVEFYNAGLNHYFISADPAEIAALDAGAFGGAWKRTGNAFSAWDVAGAPTGTVPVCRFFGTDQYRADGSRIGPNSHFYTADPDECAYVKTAWQSVASDGQSYPAWTFESNAFAVELRADSTCQGGTQPLSRTYNDGAGGDPNHRYAASPALLQAMAGWVFEGLVMCLPQSKVFFVSSSRGDDTNSGAQVAPFKTIGRALTAAAVAGGATVRIAGGAYNESLLLPPNVELIGAHSPDTWLVDPANFTTQVTGSQRAVVAGEVSNIGLRNLSITSRAGDIPGDSSIAVGLWEARGVVIADTRITAGNGFAGADGLVGAAGANGANGGAGGDAGSGTGGGGGGGGATNTPRRGGNGGAGGFGFSASGAAGGSGIAGSAGAAGGAGGAGGTPTVTAIGGGRAGSAGALATFGVVGSTAAVFGSFSVDRAGNFIEGIDYLPALATKGGPGASGGGGGGGGGGAVLYVVPLRAGGGGGGGQGGAGGGGGDPGSGGGASIGVLVISNSEVAFRNNIVRTGAGGQGGYGGSGGYWGAGGKGGLGGDNSFTGQAAGGNGGDGGNGGFGGPGGSGAGGPTMGVVYDRTSAIAGTNTITLGVPGTRSGTPTGIAAETFLIP